MNKYLIVIIVMSVVVVGILFARPFKPDNFGAMTSGHNIITGGVTNSSSSISSTATTSVTRDTDRQYVSLCNDGGSVVYLHFSSSTTGVIGEAGYRLATAACYEIDSTNLYIGAIQAVTVSGTSVLSIIK